MLPFLRPKHQPTVVEIKRKPDGEVSTAEQSEDQGLISCAEDLIKAVHAKDAKGVAQAIKAAVEICDTYPQEETHEFETEEG